MKVITQVETQGRFGNGQVLNCFALPVEIVVLFRCYIFAIILCWPLSVKVLDIHVWHEKEAAMGSEP